ncbi:hypothetical protein Scep_000191 [Stephania cephalantha]|uniref:Uncharacterized protein n=1 Tax=Stephania cephalantha TaxID=152367 RepID=A0AAP0L8D1_9MAGN
MFDVTIQCENHTSQCGHIHAQVFIHFITININFVFNNSDDLSETGLKRKR